MKLTDRLFATNSKMKHSEASYTKNIQENLAYLVLTKCWSSSKLLRIFSFTSLVAPGAVTGN